MDKKGFTLMEILAAIIILAIVLLVAIPSVTKVNNSIKKSERKNVISRIEIAASKYAFDNEKEEVYVKDLIQDGYLDGDNNSDDLLDPVDNTSMNCYKVIMTKQGNYYVATFQDNNEAVDGKCNIE